LSLAVAHDEDVFGQVVGQVVDAVIRNGCVEAWVMRSSPLDRWRQMKSSRQMQRVADEAAQACAQTAAQTAALAEAVRGLSLAAAHDDGADLSTVVVEGAGLGVCNGIYHPAPNDHQANGKPFFRNQHGTTIGWQDSDWTRRHGYRAGIGCWGIGYDGHHRYMAPGESASPAFDLSLGEPLSRIPLAAAALGVLRLAARGSLPLADLGALLRGPFLGEAESERPARALLDARLRERGALDAGLATLRFEAMPRGGGPRACPALARRLDAWMPMALKARETRQLPSAWSATLTWMTRRSSE
jgi:hypothetical protein